MTPIRIRRLEECFFLCVVVLGACEPSDKCGSNLVFQDGYCVARPAGPSDASISAPDDTAVDGPSSNLDGGELPLEVGKASGFGTACASNADCTSGAANFCAMQPGSRSGFCSVKGCAASPSLCPTGWTCFSIPGIVDFCNRPSG